MKRFTILAILTTLVGCSQYSEDLDSIKTPLKNQTEFYASMPECDTRTYVEDNKYLRWNAEDEITVFNGNSYNSHWQFSGEDGANSGNFNEIEESGFVTDTPLNLTANYAIYPYDKNITITDAGVVSLTLPAIQAYNHTYANSFSVGANTMMAVTKNTSDNFLAFKNLCGYLKLKFYGEDVTVKSITIKGNNNEKIAGNATATMAYGNEPTIAMNDDATDTITIDCSEGVTLNNDSENPTIFWVVIPETIFEEGITIIVTDTNGQTFTKTTSNAVPIKSNMIQPMAAIRVEVAPAGPANNEIWYTSTDGEVVMPNATDVFGANIVSNTYEDGKGIIKFDAPVTSIGDYAFKDCGNLKNVTIPNSVTSIGDFTFAYCSSLTSIIIPDSVTEIGKQAFLSCSSLTSVTIPDSVTLIGIYTFKYCTSLTSVTIPDSVTLIGDYAFACCSSLKAFYGKFASADNRCLIIDGVLNSFAPAGLTEYVIPDSVTSIGGQAFQECSNLKSVTIPNSVTSIREYAFRYCSSLTSVTISDGLTSIGERAFQYCSSLTSVTIPDSVTSIANDAFASCTSLTSVTISDSVTEIGYAVFWKCSSLTSVIIPDNVTSIGGQAFQNCSSLTSVTIPDSVTSIGKNAFDVCSSLTSVYCKPTTPPAGGQYMFDKSASGRKIYVPYKAVDAYKSAENWSRYASDIVGYDFETGGLPSHKHIVFPDINLKKYLIDNYDLNDDGGISDDEAANITMVYCRNKNIADLTGLEECKNITTIDCSGNYISEIKLPGLTKLVSLVCYGNPIEVLDLSNCSALKVLYIQSDSDNAIVEDELKLTYYDQAESLTIDVTNTIMDRIFICRSNILANLDVSKNIHLTQLSAYVNPNLKSIDVSKLVNLEILDLGDCAFTNLDVSQNVLLTELFVTNNKLSTLNVSQNKQLKVLKCKGNQISNLKILNNDKLETIDASNNLLSSIILSNQPALKSVNINGNTEITLLDLSNSPSIESINAIKTNLSKLIVKNKQTIVAKEDAATNRKTYIEGINIVGRNGLSIFDANGTEIKSFNTPACIISGIEGVKSVNQTKYISLTLTSGSWASVEQTWTTKGWTIGAIYSVDVRNDYKNILASYYDYFSENRYYWTPSENESYYNQGVGRGYYTNNYFGSKISESSAKGSASHYSFGMYTEE